VHWNAAILSVALAYQLRLPAHLRIQWAARVDVLLVEHKSPKHLRAAGVVMSKCIDRFFAGTHVPQGIAPTSALKENVFATVLCVVARVPLNITGPPGCGKTLAVQTVVENMRGASSMMPLFKLLPNLQQMPYQCSESSTASEVAAVFDNAVNRSRAMRQHNDIVLVFLDEAGLPTERRHALKVIHHYLDHAEVACVMLANSNMDAAKLVSLQISTLCAS
jgi:hypothetical protein